MGVKGIPEVPDDMKVGTVHKTQQHGAVVVTSYHGWAKVGFRFLSTGAEGFSAATKIRHGKLRDNTVVNVPDDLKVGSVHKTVMYGDIEVIKYKSCREVDVIFVDSGYETTVTPYCVRTGSVKDHMSPPRESGIELGGTYPTKLCGDLRVLSYKNTYEVTVEFLTTGTVKEVSCDSIRKGTPRDCYAKTLLGIGFLGEGIAPTSGKAHQHWKAMLRRCYCPNFLKVNPTYKGCVVDEEWHNFNKFYPWFVENYVEGYHLDKDIKAGRQKLYSPETCMFATQWDNNVEAFAKEYSFISPEGKRVDLYNLSEYCRGHGLEYRRMSEVSCGTKFEWKGWRKYSEK